MGRKIDRLRRVVQKLGARYGDDDMDVQRLRQELVALETAGERQCVERRKVQLCRYTFGSVARQHYFDNADQAGASQ